MIGRLYDEVDHPVRVVLCGSALSVMSDLLSGTKALRGRASVDLCLRPFHYRTAARFWGALDARTAFEVDAVMGGTPGYRDLVEESVPADPAGFGNWLASSVLNPSHALFTEADYLLREDPRLGDRAVHHSILAAIAEGARTPTAIGARIGRDRTALSHPLAVLRDTGFVRNDDDVLHQRKPSLHLTDPIIRFTQLVIAPRPAVFEDRRWEAGWRSAQPTYSSGVLGPHFEHLAREWARRFAGSDELPGEIGEAKAGSAREAPATSPVWSGSAPCWSLAVAPPPSPHSPCSPAVDSTRRWSNLQPVVLTFCWSTWPDSTMKCSSTDGTRWAAAGGRGATVWRRRCGWGGRAVISALPGDGPVRAIGRKQQTRERREQGRERATLLLGTREEGT